MQLHRQRVHLVPGLDHHPVQPIVSGEVSLLHPHADAVQVAEHRPEAVQEGPRQPGTQQAGNLADEFSVLGRVPVIGRIVASEKVTGRQRAEQVAASYRGSGLEVEIQEATAQSS
ncbi:MAG TPA: hypothetical protein VMP01_08195 [Pirellulaceae bacterium]|nr:hypothetical protein [Pirellulaceae bacterium]